MNTNQEVNTLRFDHIQESIDSLKTLVIQMASADKQQKEKATTGRSVLTLGKRWGDKNSQPGQTEAFNFASKIDPRLINDPKLAAEVQDLTKCFELEKNKELDFDSESNLIHVGGSGHP